MRSELKRLNRDMQLAWETYVKNPTEENREDFESKDDEYKIALNRTKNIRRHDEAGLFQ